MSITLSYVILLYRKNRPAKTAKKLARQFALTGGFK